MVDWIVGIASAIFALLGLVLAAHAVDIGMTTFGVGLFIFGCFLIFFLIKQHYDAVDAKGSGTH